MMIVFVQNIAKSFKLYGIIFLFVCLFFAKLFFYFLLTSNAPELSILIFNQLNLHFSFSLFSSF